MLRSLLTAGAFALLATPAFAGTVFTAQFAEPVGKATLSADSTVWTCDGNTCRAELNRKKPTVGTCKKLAKQAGKVVALTTPKGALSETELAACACRPGKPRFTALSPLAAAASNLRRIFFEAS